MAHRNSRNRWWLAALFALTTTLILAWLGFLLLIELPGQITNGEASPEQLRKLELAMTQRANGAQLLLGSAVLFGLYLTYRRIRAVESQARTAERGEITERFTRAIDQLGKTKPEDLAVRLGGIYALEMIMRDSAENFSIVQEVLAAFLREMTLDLRKLPDTDRRGQTPSTDVQAAATVLARNSPGQHGVSADKSDRISRVNLRGVDLTGVELEHLDMQRFDLTGARLLEARLSRINFANAQLGMANLDNAHLEGANLERAVLRDSSLNNAQLRRARFSHAIMSRAKLNRSNLDDSQLHYAMLKSAELRGASAQRAELGNADLGDADLSGANLDAASLFASTLTRTNMDNVQLKSADLRSAMLVGATLRGATVTQARMDGLSLYRADLTDADFKYSGLPGVDLRAAKLVRTHFEGANLTGALNLTEEAIRDSFRDAATILPDNLSHLEPNPESIPSDRHSRQRRVDRFR